ncbi:MAG: DUF3313 domain-containing protein [Nitrospirota bacterium]|nr:MAG: DUF3313 domain-containing protein [Nitrospirota bacterium]
MLRIRAIICVVIIGFLAGCAATKQARDVDQTGFLGDIYPKLREGKEGEALLVYKPERINTARFAKYSKILLDPVTVWRGEESRKSGAPQQDVQVVADHFFSLLYLTFNQDYEMVQKPSPNTLRIQVAITKLEESMVVLDVVSTVVPQARALSTLKGLATGKPAFVGEASVEAKLSDAQTGKVLAAVVDRRVGNKNLEAESFDTWGDVNEILEYWAKQARFRLCEARGGSNCVPPEEA